MIGKGDGIGRQLVICKEGENEGLRKRKNIKTRLTHIMDKLKNKREESRKHKEHVEQAHRDERYDGCDKVN